MSNKFSFVLKAVLIPQTRIVQLIYKFADQRNVQ